MLSHRLDLARRPFVDTRPVNLTAAALAFLVLFLSFVSVRTVGRYLDQSQRTRESIARLKNDVAKEEERKKAAEASLSRVDLSGLSSSVNDANSIALRRAFSWTRFLSRLEVALPEDVRVQTISLQRGKSNVPGVSVIEEAIPVQLTLISRDPDGLPKTIRALYASEYFDHPAPDQEEAPDKGPGDGRRLTLQVLYKDKGKKS
ncbi:MAG TPA: hypothetical protein VGR00_10325 [Thermoanaerobaculia bacterium]|nr:hypothetical protein [Thermoanaerobaculia bacterium]